MSVFLNIADSIAPFATIASTVLIALILYRKGTSEAAIIKVTKAEKREKLNIDYAEKIIIEVDELQDNIKGLLDNNLVTAKNIIEELELLKGNKQKDIRNIIDENMIKLDNNEESKAYYQSINKFYRLVKTDKNINGINNKIDKEVDIIRNVIGIIESMFYPIAISNVDKKRFKNYMEHIIEKYGSPSDVEGYLEDSVGNIISVCKNRML